MATVGVWLVRSKNEVPEVPLVAVPLTSYAGDESWPTLSPDGTQVAFSWDGEKQDKSDIYVKQIGVEPPFRLTSDAAMDYSPAWSPDGGFIAFLRELSPRQDRYRDRTPARRTGANSERDQGINAQALPYGPYLSWTPDSKWIVCPTPEKRRARLGFAFVLHGNGRADRANQPAKQRSRRCGAGRLPRRPDLDLLATFTGLLQCDSVVIASWRRLQTVGQRGTDSVARDDKHRRGLVAQWP